MKNFDISILPGTTRINIDCFDLVVTEPLLDFGGNKLRGITADIARHPILDHRLLEYTQDLSGSDLPFDLDGQTGGYTH